VYGVEALFQEIPGAFALLSVHLKGQGRQCYSEQDEQTYGGKGTYFFKHNMYRLSLEFAAVLDQTSTFYEWGAGGLHGIWELSGS
jgi:hypothetical protein